MVLTSQFSRAAENFVCYGGIKPNTLTKEIELSAINSNNPLVKKGELITDGESYEFLVEPRNELLRFQIKDEKNQEILMDKLIRSLPAFKSKRIHKEIEIYLDCRPYSNTDYCRYHTC